MLVEAEIVPAKRMHALMLEAKELLAIFAASQRTVRVRNVRKQTMEK
jgi:hypothetical protein